MKRKFLSVIIILSMLLLTLIPLSVSAAISGTCGSNLTWVLDNNGILTISGTGAMYNWEYYNEVPWHSYTKNIKVVYIGDNVTSIGNCAFADCSNLLRIELPNNMDSIGEYAFTNCRSLVNIVIPNGVRVIDEDTFYDCISLQSVTIPESLVTIRSMAFCNCNSLSTVYIDGTVWNVKNIYADNEPFKNATRIYKKVNVSYNANGGVGAPETLKISKNSTVTISSTTPTRAGYIFLGWSTSSSVKTAEYKANDTLTVGTSSINLYAVWEKIICTKTQIEDDTFLVTPTGVENGNRVIFVCYNGDRMVYVNPYIYAGETTIPFSTTETYDKVKVMVWENLQTCMPLCEAVDVPLN